MTAFKWRPLDPDEQRRFDERQRQLDRFVESDPDVHGCVDEYGVGQQDFEQPFSEQELRSFSKS